MAAISAHGPRTGTIGADGKALGTGAEDIEEPARDLYASGWVAFGRVTLPLILPGVFAGAMLAFVISMDDFITSNLLNSGGATTLPVYIFSLIKQGVSPQLNAISTLIMIVSVVVATVAFLVQRRR